MSLLVSQPVSVLVSMKHRGLKTAEETTCIFSCSNIGQNSLAARLVSVTAVFHRKLGH